MRNVLLTILIGCSLLVFFLPVIPGAAATEGSNDAAVILVMAPAGAAAGASAAVAKEAADKSNWKLALLSGLLGAGVMAGGFLVGWGNIWAWLKELLSGKIPNFI